MCCLIGLSRFFAHILHNRSMFIHWFYFCLTLLHRVKCRGTQPLILLSRKWRTKTWIVFSKITVLFAFYFSNNLLKILVFRMTYTNQQRSVKIKKKL